VSCLLVLAAACVAGGAVAAVPIVLPSPIALVQPPPPLTTGVVSPIENENELRFPGRIGNTERVVVGLREDGSASAVDVGTMAFDPRVSLRPEGGGPSGTA